MVIKVPLWGRLAIVVTIVAGLVGLFVIHLGSQEYVVPDCLRLHAGNVFVDVPYSPGVLTYVPDPPLHSLQILFYRTALINHAVEPFFVLRIGEDLAAFEPVDMFINSPDPGPKFTEKVVFNGHDAAFAPGERMFYKIPYANRTIGIEYSTKDLTADEVPVVEAMMKKITITRADVENKGASDGGELHGEEGAQRHFLTYDP
jgi:hypothetical protein